MPKTQETFTESLTQLDTIVQRFRGETLPLEEALTLFEAGVQRVKECQATLNTARGKIEVLVGELDNQPSVEPFDA